MSTSDSESLALQSAVCVIWQECGHAAPQDTELVRVATNLRHALMAGRQIPRVADKTLQPMTGRRHDIEAQAVLAE